jgi:hypothetical protein
MIVTFADVLARGGECTCAACVHARSGQARAMKLLTSCLDKTQRQSFEASGQFDVRGSGGGLYRITPQTTYNVFRIGRQGFLDERLCAGTYDDAVPLFDMMLAQKLALETDEAAFRAVAHRSF